MEKSRKSPSHYYILASVSHISGLFHTIFTNYLQRNPPVPPTVHIFASPQSRRQGDSSAPHVVILPIHSNASTEPALLLISPTGSIRLWSSIFLGLAGAERFVEAVVPLFLHSRNETTVESISSAKALVPSLSLNTTRTSVQGGSPLLYSLPDLANSWIL